jgi:hypothetical protein
MPGAISSLISIASLRVEGLGLCGLCVSEFCVSCFTGTSVLFWTGIDPRLVPWGGARRGATCLLRDYPKY